MPPRRGVARCRTDDGGREREERVAVGVERCLPAWTRRREGGGREVRKDRRVRRVLMEVSVGTVRGKAAISH